MNLCLFFEGTWRGVAGKVTNVTRLRDICVDDVRQKLDASAVVLHDAHVRSSPLPNFSEFHPLRRAVKFGIIPPT